MNKMEEQRLKNHLKCYEKAVRMKDDPLVSKINSLSTFSSKEFDGRIQIILKQDAKYLFLSPEGMKKYLAEKELLCYETNYKLTGRACSIKFGNHTQIDLVLLVTDEE